jgi:hypothetical protein
VWQQREVHAFTALAHRCAHGAYLGALGNHLGAVAHGIHHVLHCSLHDMLVAAQESADVQIVREIYGVLAGPAGPELAGQLAVDSADELTLSRLVDPF